MADVELHLAGGVKGTPPTSLKQKGMTMILTLLSWGGMRGDGGGVEVKAAVGKLHSCSPQPALVLVALTHDDADDDNNVSDDDDDNNDNGDDDHGVSEPHVLTQWVLHMQQN